MEHTDAIQTMAAERYALGEMQQGDRDAFEEHFFDCAECGQSVRDGATVIATTRSLKPARLEQPPRTWWAVAAVLALTAILGYQNLVTIPQMRERSTPRVARVLHPVSFLTAGARSGSFLEVVAARNEDISFYFDIPPQPVASTYVAEVHDEAGATRISFPVTAEEARESILITLPAEKLPAGNFELVVNASHGGKREVVARYAFSVRYR